MKEMKKYFITNGSFLDNIDLNKNSNLNKTIERKIKLNKIKGKKMKNSIKNKNQIINILIIKFILINVLINLLLCHILFLSESSYITLKIKGIGYNYIFGYQVNRTFRLAYFPDEIYINEKRQDFLNYSYYFNQTDNIVKLIWNKTINNMANMFDQCNNITEVDLSNFDSSIVINTGSLFRGCISLTSVNLNNFNTTKTTSMASMFNGCTSLLSLNLSSFNTSNCKNMCYMLQNCRLLTSLDLSNFDTSQTIYLHSMFNGCLSLKYLNIKNFNFSLPKVDYIFNNVPENILICLEENNINYNISLELGKRKCYNIDCSKDWNSKIKKVINRTIVGCQCELNNCLSCPNLNIQNNLCTKCENGFFQKENDDLMGGEYFNCYEDIEGYYLDKKDLLLKKCFYTCKTCEQKGDNINHKCLECDANYSFAINLNNYFNCYKNCSYYHYFDNENNYYCTINLTCPKEYPLLIQDKNECINKTSHAPNSISSTNSINSFSLFQIKSIIVVYSQIKNSSESIETIINNLFNELNINDINKGIDKRIVNDNIEFIFTSTLNQKNNEDKNNITMNLGQCENILKKEYNISYNDSLYILQII